MSGVRIFMHKKHAFMVVKIRSGLFEPQPVLRYAEKIRNERHKIYIFERQITKMVENDFLQHFCIV